MGYDRVMPGVVIKTGNVVVQNPARYPSIDTLTHTTWLAPSCKPTSYQLALGFFVVDDGETMPGSRIRQAAI
ncbi:hypothetical protein SAMN04489737_0514 [Arcanobacterium phocae]|uniref:Uncharacterized protein n=1 Tax=Arcanobacterium phocae TaxID=131112 RepID=A0A1H2LBV5_9ACTO|nr:hypothetical protein SAMN04489737_0514 [Arcanobacterium phocae]